MCSNPRDEDVSYLPKGVIDRRYNVLLFCQTFRLKQLIVTVYFRFIYNMLLTYY